MVYEFYRALGIPKDATDDEMKKAYKHLALFYNPKRHARRPKTPEDPLMSKNEKNMKEMAEEMHRNNMYLTVGEAFEVLSDPQRRAIYDKFGERALKEGIVGPEGFIAPYAYHGDPDQTFREFFGTDNPFAELVANACAPMDAFVSKESQGFRPKEQGSTRPLPITMEEAYNGAIRKVIVPKKHLCADGNSIEQRDHVLTVEIPKGGYDGMEFNFPNEGDEGPNSMPADIIFKLAIQPHPVYTREGNNLALSRTISLYEALCGVVIPINTLDGRSFRIYNVNLVQPGYEKVIKGEGMPLLGEPGKKGDLIIRFNVRYPTKLNQSQKQNLRAALDPNLN